MIQDLYIKAAYPDAWVRNRDWLTLPTVESGDEKFAGLYAIYSGSENNLRVRLGGSGGHVLAWGEGSTQTTTNNTYYTKAYDYTAISGSVSVDHKGRNYKQVIVTIDFETASTVELERNNTNLEYTTGWLDVVVAAANMTKCTLSQQRRSTELERLRIVQSNITNPGSAYQYTNRLRILELNIGTGASSLASTFGNTGNIRDTNNNPFSLTLPAITSLASTFANCLTTKLGNMTFTGATLTQSTFKGMRNLISIGDINVGNSVKTTNFFNANINMVDCGTITTSANLTHVGSMFNSCYNLRSVNLTNCSGLTSVSNMLVNCDGLESLILTGLTKGGVAAKDGRMNTAALDAFMTSIGTANGSQTLNISGHPGSQTCDPSIATAKGWTITVS